MAELSPEQKQEHMQKWGAWMGQLSEAGKLVGGQPLQRTGRMMSDGGNTVTDGPYAEGKEIVGGYIILKAADYDEALKLTKSCPIFEGDGFTEIREIAAM